MVDVEVGDVNGLDLVDKVWGLVEGGWEVVM